MKMIFSCLFASLLFISTTNAQIKAVSGMVICPPDTLYIGYYVTTSLVFDATVWRADGGSKGIILQKQPGITNVLNVKANKTDFTPTNLHVYTGDGKMFTFPVVFSVAPMKTTLFIRDLPVPAASTVTSPDTFSEQVNEEELNTYIQSSRIAPPFLSRQARADQMTVKLRTIHYAKDLLFITVELVNHSTLPYDIDFIRLYVQDKEKIKRSTAQQREIVPVYKDVAQTILIDQPVRYVLVMPKFSLGTNKQFYLEIFERNGGRHLAIQIKNRHLLQAKPFTYGDQK
jgi:conjugative transposon TraN protein